MPDQAEIHRLSQDEDENVRFRAAEALRAAFSQVPDKILAWQDLHRLIQDKDSYVRWGAAEVLVAAFSQAPDKTLAWQDLHRLTQDEEGYVRVEAAKALRAAFSQVPDKDLAWHDLIRLTKDEDSYVRVEAAKALDSAFGQAPDRTLAWHDLIRLTHDNSSFVRENAAKALRAAFSQVPDKILAWHDLHRLTRDINSFVRLEAAKALRAAFSQVPDKDLAWHDLIRLTKDEDRYVRWEAAKALRTAFSQAPDKTLAWQDLHRLIQDEDSYVRWGAAEALGVAFSQVADKILAWQDLHRLIQDEDSYVRWGAAEALGVAFSQVPDITIAWQDLHWLVQDEDRFVRLGAAEALGAAFSQAPDKILAWQDLHRLIQDEESTVRTYAYHSLGRASVFKATESDNRDIMKKELEAAVAFFEKSSQENTYSPARFCFPFYRSYFAITFQEAKEDEVQRYLRDAKNAVEGSESKDELLQTVENLARALQESQRLKGRSMEEIARELNVYRWYCDKAASHMTAAEKSAPGAVKLMRKCNPMLEERIQFTIREIQDLARQICQVTAGRGPGAEEFCDQIKDSARSLSTADFNMILNIISEFGLILMEKTVLLPEGERDLVESLLDDVANIGPVPEKLDKLKKVVKFYLSRMKDDKFLQEMSEKLDEIYEEIKALRESLPNRFDSSQRKILSAIFERLDKDRLEIIREILDAAEKDRIPKELIEETLVATEDLISEMKSMQAEIRDPAIASWDEALNSPEIEIENRLKVSIPIIPLLLTYEGSYNFKSGLKLDEAWNKLRNLGRV